MSKEELAKLITDVNEQWKNNKMKRVDFLKVMSENLDDIEKFLLDK